MQQPGYGAYPPQGYPPPPNNPYGYSHSPQPYGSPSPHNGYNVC